jgi:hypothetical protein
MRISATAVECFRLYSQPDQDWLSEAELIATIKGELVPTPAILLGHAFGRVLETPDIYRVSGGFRYGHFTFSDDTIAPALDVVDRRGVFEVKATKRYGTCELVAKVDHILGTQISEFKTTTTSFDINKYFASYQWRLYLDAFEARCLTYHVFCLNDHGNGVVELRGIESFNLFPYAELHHDCCALIGRFAAFVTQRGLDSFLRQRQADAEAAA